MTRSYVSPNIIGSLPQSSQTLPGAAAEENTGQMEPWQETEQGPVGDYTQSVASSKTSKAMVAGF